MLAMRSATFLTTVVTPAKIGTHRFASLNSLRMVLSIKKARAWRAVKAPAEKRAQKKPTQGGHSENSGRVRLKQLDSAAHWLAIRRAQAQRFALITRSRLAGIEWA